MKTRICAALLLAIAGLPLPVRSLEQAAGPTSTQPAPAPPAVAAAPATQVAPVQWSSGVSEVLKLSHAGVNEQTIIAYISSSGQTYRLSAADIIELKNQGVSDAVLTAMLTQKPQGGPTKAPAYTYPTTPPAMAPDNGTAYPQSTYVVPSGYSYPYYADYPYYYPYYYSYPYYSGGYYGFYYPWYSHCYYGYHGYHCYYPYANHWHGGTGFHGSGGFPGGGGFHGPVPHSVGVHGTFAMGSHGGGGGMHGGGGGGGHGGHR